MPLKKVMILLVGMAGFLFIAYFISNYESLAFDSNITDVVYSMRSTALTYAVLAITFSANWQTITLGCLILLFLKQTRKPVGLPVACVTLLSTLLKSVLKAIFERPRPDEFLWLINESGYSFPSGHALSGLVFYGLVIYYINLMMKNKKAVKSITAFLVVLIILIGFSRVYLGVHYPTDVLAGFCIGIVLLFLFLLFKDRYDASVKKDAL